MANPINTTNLTLTEDVYYRLKHLKEVKGWSFTETLDRLCELEFQNNYIEKIIEYSLITENSSRLFKVTFRKDNMYFEYYAPDNGYTTQISKWGLDNKVLKLFYEFIKEDYARCLLEYIPISIEFEDFIIQKIL